MKISRFVAFALTCAGAAWAQTSAPTDKEAVAVPSVAKVEFVSGAIAGMGAPVRIGELKVLARNPNTAAGMRQHALSELQTALEASGMVLAAEGEGSRNVVTSTWQISYQAERQILAALPDEERAARCPEKGADVGRVIAGAVGLATGLVGSSQGASMIASGARAGAQPGPPWQRFSHLATADRIACGVGEYVLETKVHVAGAGTDQGFEFVVRTAVSGGAMPLEAAILVPRAAASIVDEIKALQTGTCDRSIRCKEAMAEAPAKP